MSPPMEPGPPDVTARDLCAEATRLLEFAPPGDPADSPAAERVRRFRAAARRNADPGYTALVSGLRSVGKSTFVGALWGDIDLLPTAVRDCTQTNTLIRQPDGDERDRSLRLRYLDRDEAVEFATRGLAFYRLAEMLNEVLGPTGPKLEDLPCEERLRAAADAVRRLFDERPDIYVLHEHLTEQLDQLEEFLAFIATPQFRPGETVDASWEDRQEHLMGHRRSDGRTLDVGKLLALRHVEVIRTTDRWRQTVPRLIDTPWIPTFHNARRCDLIIEQAHEADILVVISLSELYTPEEWLKRVLEEHPRLARRTVLVFNQVDTIDASQLFSRGGFAEAYERTLETIGRLKITPDNVVVACARSPFLDASKGDAFVDARRQRLRDVLKHLGATSSQGRDRAFADRLREACDPADAGLGSLMRRMDVLWRGEVAKERRREAVESLAAVSPLDVGEPAREAWAVLAERARREAMSIW